MPVPLWAASQDSIEAVQQAYVSYYGRPGDYAGVQWWADQLDANGGQLGAIINDFGTSSEYQARFGNLTTEQLVSNLYQQMFGRSAEQAGLDYWVGEINSGARTLGAVALEIGYGAQNDDLSTLSNRTGVAIALTDEINAAAKSYEFDQIASARDLLMTVTSNTDVSSFISSSAFENLIAAFPSSNNGGGSGNGTLITAEQLAVLAQTGVWRSYFDLHFSGQQVIDMGSNSITTELEGHIEGANVISMKVGNTTIETDSCDAAVSEVQTKDEWVNEINMNESEEAFGCSSFDIKYYEVSSSHIRMEYSCGLVSAGTVDMRKVSDGTGFNFGSLTFDSNAHNDLSTGSGVCGDRMYVNSTSTLLGQTTTVKNSTISVRAPYGNSIVHFEFMLSGHLQRFFFGGAGRCRKNSICADNLCGVWGIGQRS